jgi:conjugal transfer pilin signal peptidase TrbI
MPTNHASNAIAFASNRIFTRAASLGHGLIGHYKKYGVIWALSVAALIVFQLFFKVGINVTESLPSKVFLITKFDRNVSKGDFVSFTWGGSDPYPKGVEFVKMVQGMPGDVVSYRGRWVFINDTFVAIAKTHSKSHKPLELGPSGVIPEGKYFVYATHPDSLDSRYALTGWIDQSSVRGRAYPIF